jgi:hypothetical protein
VNKQPLLRWPTLALFATLRTSIQSIETTGETLTSRAGMALFSRYLRNLGLLSVLKRLFGSMRKSEKGLPIPVLFHQILCLFLDGTRFSLVRFDELKEEDGYAGAIEVSPESMASSHQIKRFFYPVKSVVHRRMGGVYT